VNIVLKPGHADVQLAPGRWVDPARMIQVVSAAGVKPKPNDIRMSAVGKVQASGDSLLFILTKMRTPTVLLLRGGDGEAEKAIITELRQQALLRTLVEIEGLWEPWKAAEPARASLPSDALLGGTTGEAGSVYQAAGTLAVTRFAIVRANATGS
jgi:hypothetical protein